MKKQTLNNPHFLPNQKIILPVAALVLLCILLTLTFDFWESKFQQTAYYFSESLLFSLFWWLFVPFLFCQFRFAKRERIVIWILAPMLAHAFAYPALIWLVSAAFYTHTFEYWQTFQYGMMQYYFALLVLYSFPIGFFVFWKHRQENKKEIPSSAYAASLVARESDRHVHIDAHLVLYLSANPPYTNIHTVDKKYLLPETLKSLSSRLNPSQFVRIHKSTMVNLAFVKSHQSRQNGDYDVLLKDDTVLRLSRNYVREFKARLDLSPRDAAS